jgi:hypothetical protein
MCCPYPHVRQKFKSFYICAYFQIHHFCTFLVRSIRCVKTSFLQISLHLFPVSLSFAPNLYTHFTQSKHNLFLNHIFYKSFFRSLQPGQVQLFWFLIRLSVRKEIFTSTLHIFTTYDLCCLHVIGVYFLLLQI